MTKARASVGGQAHYPDGTCPSCVSNSRMNRSTRAPMPGQTDSLCPATFKLWTSWASSHSTIMLGRVTPLRTTSARQARAAAGDDGVQELNEHAIASEYIRCDRLAVYQ